MLDPRTHILLSAVHIARSRGLHHVIRPTVARQAGCAPSLVSYYFHTMPRLVHAVVRHAVQTEDLCILVQALAVRHPVATRAPRALRHAAADSLK